MTARFCRDTMTSSRAQVTKNADIKATIDAMNPNCPRYQAHATLHYNMGSDEKQARAKFTSYESSSSRRAKGPGPEMCWPSRAWGDHAPRHAGHRPR